MGGGVNSASSSIQWVISLLQWLIKLSCILKYTGLCLSVRKIMGDQYNSNNLSNMIYPYIPETAKLLLKAKKGCKDFYLNQRYKDEKPKHETKWNSDLSLELNWKRMYVNCFKVTKNTKLQWFQYRLINRILPVKTYLKKLAYWKMTFVLSVERMWKYSTYLLLL